MVVITRFFLAGQICEQLINRIAQIGPYLLRKRCQQFSIKLARAFYRFTITIIFTASIFANNIANFRQRPVSYTTLVYSALTGGSSPKCTDCIHCGSIFGKVIFICATFAQYLHRIRIIISIADQWFPLGPARHTRSNNHQCSQLADTIMLIQFSTHSVIIGLFLNSAAQYTIESPKHFLH